MTPMQHGPEIERRDQHLHPARHWGGFLVSGGLAFIVDAGVLELGVRILGLQPATARPLSIACAMLTAWLSHRTLTFAVAAAPSLREFFRYLLSAGGTALVNYFCFLSVLYLWPWAGRFPALLIATGIATVFSYLSLRFGVFRQA
ncbi:MAG: GtrA family protein [Proteobacteria bacterium]|nr:GtrA family protein [Pseudomonadota bacterium]